MLNIYCSFLWLLISELYCTCILFFGKKKITHSTTFPQVNTQLEFYLCHLLIHKSFQSMVDMTVIFSATTLSESTQNTYLNFSLHLVSNSLVSDASRASESNFASFRALSWSISSLYISS